ncbi:MAG: rhodanese-like domain-containing protein [Betaproteobacteria bacterium]|nr:rhodanese-like domain-containing protein [Betaproteobacteria bacterium]
MIERLDTLEPTLSVYQQINVDGLDALRSQGPVVLLDVRTEAEVSRGVIAGTRHIVLNELPARAPELDAKAVTVVYCQSGGRSAQACEFLSGQGFGTLYNLQGGILGWLRAGRPLSQLGE